jgi:hypothetical protein
VSNVLPMDTMDYLRLKLYDETAKLPTLSAHGRSVAGFKSNCISTDFFTFFTSMHIVQSVLFGRLGKL